MLPAVRGDESTAPAQSPGLHLEALHEDALLAILQHCGLAQLRAVALVSRALRSASRAVRRDVLWQTAHLDETQLDRWMRGKYAPRRVARPSAAPASGAPIGYSGLMAVDLLDEWLVSGGHQAVCHVWRVPKFGACECVHALPHPSEVTCVALRPGGAHLATACRSGELRLWCLDAGRPHGRAPSPHDGDVFGLVWLGPHALLSGGTDRTLRRWCARAERALSVEADTPAVSALAYDAQLGLVASPRRDYSIALLAAPAGAGALECRALLVGHTRPVLAVAFGAGSSRVVSGGCGGTIRVWDATTGLCTATLAHGSPGTYALALHGDTLVSGECDEACARVWSVSAGRVVARLHKTTGGGGSVCALAIAGAAERVACGDNVSNCPHVWEASHALGRSSYY